MESLLRVYSVVCFCVCMVYLPTHGVNCPFDPCFLGDEDPCPGGRECRPEICRYGCHCTETSTYELCLTDTTAGPTDVSTQHPIQGDNCPAGHPCLNGHCMTFSWDKNDVQCICYDGWHGVNCTESDVTTTESSGPREINGTASVLVSEHACSADYVLRPLAERMCPHGLPCYMGVCDGGSRCACDDGATGNLCQDHCCLECGDYGYCYYDSKNETELCNCFSNYTGDFCETYKPPPQPVSEATWYWWVVGVCVVVLVALLVVLVVAPYLMWRHRVILVMKIVHYFQGYEDDDEREWDAFVSYKSCDRDEKFVVHTLMPRLEGQLGFRLNLHFRDFVLGENIANNIINAVQGSRRTILIITPQYVTSEWTRFEYNVAQQEMLKRKNRIIPILLDDISDCTSEIDPTLKTILDSVTYLKYPVDESDDKTDEKFWKRLQLTLPKKRTLEESSNSHEHKENIEVSVIKSDKNSNDYFHNLSNSLKGTEDIYDTINESDIGTEDIYDTLNESDLDIRFANEKNKHVSNKHITIPNGDTYITHC